MEEVLQIIEDKLDADEQYLLSRKLQISQSTDLEDQPFPQKLVNIPWRKIEEQLEMLKRTDVVIEIYEKTLVTEGILHCFILLNLCFDSSSSKCDSKSN